MPEPSSRAPDYDAIIIGSGTCGATLARELSRQRRKVLLLECGKTVPLKESLGTIVAVADQVNLGEGKLATVRALTTGGSTSLYFGVVNYPDLSTFEALGIDLAQDLAQVRSELPIAQLPDEWLSPQARQLRDAAVARGHAWKKNDMLIDLAGCAQGYSYDAKWKARAYVDDAVRQGAVLVNRATVKKVLRDGNTAVGVEYQLKTGPLRTQTQRAFGARVILAAGELATPAILRDSGVPGIGAQGFYCNPGYAIFGLVPGMQATTSYVGAMGCTYDEGIELGDANIPKPLHGPMMLGGLKLRHMVSFPRTIGIGVKVKDTLGGEFKADGRLRKGFGREDLQKLEKGRQEAVKVLAQAGARHIVDFGITAAGRVGGLVRIQEHVDARLETSLRNLHVCDGSVIPDDFRGTPTLTLVAMARYLSRQLLAAP